MLSFLARPVPRTNTASQTTLYLDHGASSLTFHTDGTEPDADFLMTCSIAPGKFSSVDPPYHFHKKFPETFSVSEGEIEFTLDGKPTRVPAGESITVETYQSHAFRNSSDKVSVVSLRFDSSDQWKAEERFFRNVYGHLEDCNRAARKAGKDKPSISPVQLATMICESDTTLTFPGPKVIMHPLGTALTWFMGVFIGKWMLGYKYTYPEYSKENAK